MSLRDDSVIRDEFGRIVKGSPGLHRKPEQADTPLEPLPADPNDFDAAILFVARNYGRKDLPRMGLIGYCVSLTERPADFATLLGKALARREDAATSPGSGATTVVFSTAPSGLCIDANGKLIEADAARTTWSGRVGFEEPPPAQSQDEAPPPVKPVKLALMENEFQFGGDDHDDDGGDAA